MKRILETKRTVLREMTQEDYPELCEILQDAEAMYAYEHAFSDAEVQEWLNKQMENYESFGVGFWAVIDKDSGRVIGQVGLLAQNIGGKEELEIAYLLKRKYWHKGYATEAAIACKEYAFNILNKNRVVSIIRDNNHSSQRVAQRVGMKLEGQIVKHYYNIDMPHYIYAIEKCEMNNDEIKITNKNLIEPKHKSEHEPYEYYKYEVTERKRGNQCYVAIYEIPPQKANYPYHYHLKNEEVFYIISGNGILETPSGNRTISAGDIIVCPPSEKGAHKIINSSHTEMLTYLDCDTVNYPDIAYYPHSDKVGIILNGESNTFYKKNTAVEYYEGE